MKIFASFETHGTQDGASNQLRFHHTDHREAILKVLRVAYRRSSVHLPHECFSGGLRRCLQTAAVKDRGKIPCNANEIRLKT
jgi:hypothetical protein